VDADQELRATALVNVASALFGGMIAGGGMSSSAVKEGAGGRTQVANLVTWAVTIATVLFFTPLFASLPEAVLGALIIHAVWHIIASRKLIKLRQEAPAEVWFGVASMAGVLFLDVLQGMVVGLVGSMLFVIYRTAKPHVASLGRVPGEPGLYSDLERHPDSTAVPGVLIVRPDAQIYYANAIAVRDRIKQLVATADPAARVVVFDASAQDTIDITSTDVLRGYIKTLQTAGIAWYVADAHAPVVERGRETGLLDAIGAEYVFPTLDAAVDHATARTEPHTAPEGEPRLKRDDDIQRAD
jgi:SulP family sulfate permease